MTTEEYRQSWLEAIRLSEIETNEVEAESFIAEYCYNRGIFASMDDNTLLQTFTRLVVYEQKYHIKMGSTTPTAPCYRELLARTESNTLDREFVYDVGDWAADYSDNCYVPMGNYRGYGPRKYFAFWDEYESRVALEIQAKEERLERKRAAGKAKVEATKLKHQERLNTIQQLREKTIEDCIIIIRNSGKSVFYYYELIEEWFINKSLSNNQKNKILSMFPTDSTRHNNRKRKNLETM